MKHIVLHTFGSLGDLHPYLALGLGLKRHGQQVTVATQAYYREKVLEISLGFHATRPDYRPDDPEVLERAMHPVSGTEYVIRGMSFPFVKATYTDLLEILSETDLLIAGPLAYAAPIAVEKTGNPWLSSVLQPIQFFSQYDPPVLYPFLPEWLRRLPWLYRLGIKLGKRQTERWARPVYDFREELGLSKGKNPALEGQYSPLGTLAPFSPTFAPPQPDWPPKTMPTGFLFYDRLTHGEDLDPALKAFLEAGEPPVIFTLGSAAVYTPGDFYKHSLKVVKMLGCRAIFLVGKGRKNESWTFQARS